MRIGTIGSAAAALLLSGTAQAAIYTGQDDGSAVGGPNPLSTAAAAAFASDAATYGALGTLTFDGDATRDSNSYSYPGLTITTTNDQIANGFTGISDVTYGDLYGYDVTAGGAGKWLGFPLGGATFSFAAPTHSFGFYATGTQADFDARLTVTIDGVSYDAPVNSIGGASYFGYTSATPFSTVTIARSGNDAWGVDGISYNLAGRPAVPEPATWATMIAGVGVAGGMLRRRARRTLAVA